MENPMTPMRRLFNLLEKDRKSIYQVYIYALFNGLVNLSLPLGIQAIINLIQGAEVSTAWIVLVFIVIGGIAFNGFLQLMQLRIVENLAQNIFSRASFEFAYRIPKIKFSELYNYYAPELANRFFDTLTIQKGLPKLLIDFSLAVFQIIVGLIVLSLYHPFFILYGLVLIALVYTIISYSGPRGLRTSLAESKSKYKVAHWLEEVARTKVSFKLIGDPQVSMDHVDGYVSDYLKNRENHFSILIKQFISLVGFKVLIAAGLLIIGSLLVFRQEMNIGQFVAAEIIIILVIGSVEKLIQSLDSIYDVLTALEKIGYVTDMRLDDESGLTICENDEDISTSLHDLYYYFPDSTRPVLDNININLPINKSLVIMGSSGSGKSTLMQIWSGIVNPSSGVIKFNGLSLQSLNFTSLRTNIGYALSTNTIFKGTILENITMGRPDITSGQIEEVLNMLFLSDFLTEQVKGLNTQLDPEGKRIPRNVINKIALARAIITFPKLIMLEDPLDHVPKSEKKQIIKSLTSPDRPWSIIVTTVDELWLDYIGDHIVLDHGHIVHTTLKD